MRQIEGYTLFRPKTMAKHRYACLVLLVKNEVEGNLQPQLMHEDVAVIWVSLQSGRKTVMKVKVVRLNTSQYGTVGRILTCIESNRGIYREHRLLLKPKPNISVSG